MTLCSKTKIRAKRKTEDAIPVKMFKPPISVNVMSVIDGPEFFKRHFFCGGCWYFERDENQKINIIVYRVENRENMSSNDLPV